MRHCPKCGRENSPTARFCQGCGIELIEHRPDSSGSKGNPFEETSKALGVASVILGAITFGVQWLGGLCCGWIGWPLAVGAVICGILAISGGERTLGWIGIVLSVAMLALQVLMLIVGAGSLGRLLSGMP
jgi:hypothetical protein